MLRRLVGVVAAVGASMILVPLPAASAHVALPTCKSSNGKSASGPNLSLWKLKKSNSGGGSGGGNASDSTPKKRQCPVVVRLPD